MQVDSPSDQFYGICGLLYFVQDMYGEVAAILAYKH